jgi:hypothetical protein
MISVELSKRDLLDQRVEVRNLPGTLFGGASPLLKPFMRKLEDLLPPEKRGWGNSYIQSNLHSYIDSVHAEDARIRVVSGEKVVEISREELGRMMGDRYPSSGHQRLNLPGLLFLQSSPSVQASCIAKLRQEHNLRLPEGRRTLRYLFHVIVVSIDADKERIRIRFDPGKLPKGTESLGRQ